MIQKKKFDKSLIPNPIYPNQDFIHLYWKAWKLAWDHVLTKPAAPQSPYIDEALNENVIWIWDTCFMALYCRYAYRLFPSAESLNNFYFPLHEGVKSPLKIQHVDNPPLFAWVEYENFKVTGDLNRLYWLLVEKKFLQKHYEYIENCKRYHLKRAGRVCTFARKRKYGFQWKGVSSGMDNTPRGRDKSRKMLWLDLLAQQALSAKYILKIAKILGEGPIYSKYGTKYKEMRNLLNCYYWNEEVGIYYDIYRKNPRKQIKVKTPATYWPMLAEICSEEQAKQLAKKVEDPSYFGGVPPWPSVSRDDKDFNPQGEYWRGGVWLPIAYMGTKALEKYGYFNLAHRSVINLLTHMIKTYKTYEPHTIWEVYSPTEAKPATYKKNKEVFRPEFCGWSALAPISLFIENILGIHEINARKKQIKWKIFQKERHGLQNLHFGDIETDLIYDNGKVSVRSDNS
ncbi:MAG: MGH1-like glycoside hydrolase domain-containing protein, partial [Promethearchaeia archaeon]